LFTVVRGIIGRSKFLNLTESCNFGFAPYPIFYIVQYSTFVDLPRAWLTTPNATVVVDPGDDVEATCAADGQPPPRHVYWVSFEDRDEMDVVATTAEAPTGTTDEPRKSGYQAYR